MLDNVNDQYVWQHERWRLSHGDVLVFAQNVSVAFTPPARPMVEATVALITTGGAHLATQPPYDMEARTGDISIRFIPRDADDAALRFTHDHYDHTSADRDPNCIFPLAHLRAFETEGRIGAVAATHVGASGWIPNPDRFLAQAAPLIVDRLAADRVDVVLLTGG